MDKQTEDLKWARNKVRRLLVSVLLQTSQHYALMAKLAARK
jgi:hypothetical protein